MERFQNLETYDSHFAINCDWLQVHVKHSAKLLEEQNRWYRVEKKGQSKVFRTIYEVTCILTNKVIGNYCTDASECIMLPNEGIFKFENSQLYSHENLRGFVELFLDRMNFKFIGITRFDIAFDFQCFANGLKPGEFINKYMSKEIVYCKAGNKKFGVYGKQHGGELDFESLTLGSRRSNVVTRLYNKTKELEDNGKPWIKRVHDANFENDGFVWRLEFSVCSMNAFMRADERVREMTRKMLQKDRNLKYPQAVSMAVKELGVRENYTSLEVLEIDKMYGLFQGLFRNYFRFKKKEHTGQRVARMKELNLWVFDYDFLREDLVKRNTMLKQSSRSTKIFINALDKANREFRLFDENFSWTAKELLGKIIDMHDLHDYAKRKNIDYTCPENYVENVNEWNKVCANELALNQQFMKANNDRISYETKLEFDHITY